MLTKKGKYGLKAMIHLAGLDTEGIAQIGDIAQANGIPKKFLDQILSELRKAGLVYSKKGKAGGYALAKPADSISVGQIVRVLDGPLAPIPCSSVTAYRACGDCGDEDSCAVRLIMVEARNALSAVLDSRSLAEMRALPSQQSARPAYSQTAGTSSPSAVAKSI